MLSMFRRDKKGKKHRIDEVSFSGSNDHVEAVKSFAPKGATIHVPSVMVLAGETRRIKVRHFLDEYEIAQIAEMVGIPAIQEVVKDDPAAHRQAKCEHGHLQISENVIHWPSGTEDCRVCYMSWPSTIRAKQLKADRAKARKQAKEEAKKAATK